ncbi:E3 ubiquitin-protein ligase COP1-like isoform X2 [Nematostella vectensis]|uniref:E3 ubiquitin-protein ligase COP1-like isoform X2 n=1 Tax=Nematostella vectensis TaxID=45351 RepID=UPI002076EBDF|nr:E3 ubiquitin-protein ligase COP1-like isoform X2 [Nematostella vectensis]
MARELGASSSTQRTARRRSKRPHPPIYGGIANSFSDRNSDFVCPICFDTIDEAFITKCGHTFCYHCISRSLTESNRCPKCNFVIEKADQIFPNFLLNELIQKYKEKQAQKKSKLDITAISISTYSVQELQDMLSSDQDWNLADVNYLLDILMQKKQQLEADGKAAQHELLKDFLLQVKRHKQEQLDQLTQEIKLIDEDMVKVKDMIEEHQRQYSALSLLNLPMVDKSIFSEVDHAVPTTPTAKNAPATLGNDTVPSTSSSEVPIKGEDTPQDGFNGSQHGAKRLWCSTSQASRRKRIHQHFDDLEKCYFAMRQGEIPCDSSSDALDDFTESLAKFTKFSGFRPLATLSYASDIYNGSSIVSSIEFDRDLDYFAIAGVTKKIKVFEYGTVIRDVVDIHYPINEMVCNSKISSISWSSYHKGLLASSDYEGTVTLWDAFTGTKTRSFQEHEKRCWSVDFNHVDPKLLASGSDDAKVKLWSTNMEHSVACLEAKANVCCVKFNPESRYHLSFGSADHCVHYYDLRHAAKPINVFKGHRKAVSYTKFINSTEIVSASTDSQLKLWNINKPHCLRTFKGHINEKNFVGLASNGDYVACGSENNSLYLYYKGLSKQLLTFKFDTVKSVLEKDKKEDDANEFVSAVCWRTGSNVVVAANSQGTIKVLELV